MEYILYYFAAINFLSVIVCCVDKSAAKNKKRRISEKTLFGLSLLGGAVGMYITMRVIRHKTLHKRFMIGLPLIILAQLAVILLIYFKKI